MTQRILRGTAATLNFTNEDADGNAIDATGTLTVTVTKADGTAVLTNAATNHGTLGKYTVAVTGAQTAALNILTATWSDSSSPTSAQTSTHEIVGGYLFSVAQAQAFESLAAVDPALIIAGRCEVEDELQRIRQVPFTTRYARCIVDGTGTSEIVLPEVSWLSAVRSVSTLTQAGSATSTPFTAGQLAACVVTEDGRIRRGDWDVFDLGVANIVVEVEYGFTAWGADLRTAALTRLRERLNRPASGIPDRAVKYSSMDGYSYGLGAQDAESTGNPYVDATYSRYPRPNQGVQPASRILSFRPQATSIFRGWPQ